MSRFAIILAGTMTLSACIATGPGTVGANYGPHQETGEKTLVAEDAFQLTDGSEVRLSGSATVGSWNSASRTISARLEPGLDLGQIGQIVEQVRAAAASGRRSGEITVDLAPPSPPEVTLSVPVKSLKSGNSKMEADMHKALKAKAHPQIHYEFKGISQAHWQITGERENPVIVLATLGDLSLAGVTRPIEMKVRIKPLGDNRFSAVGRERLDMKAFGITPPSALFGLIRAHETVEVVFDLRVSPMDRQAD